MSSRLLLICLATCLILSLSSPAIAATVVVKADGTGAAVTIQAGIDAANHGDTVLLEPGIYIGVGNRDVDFTGKRITVTSVGGAAVTIIDCQGLGRAFTLTSRENENSVISGVTIKNGSAEYGGGIYAHIAKPTITDNIIMNNTATEDGGGIYIYGAISTTTPPIVSGNTITGNVVSGGVYQRGGGLWVNSTNIVIEQNTISGNTAVDGGGIYLSGDVDNVFRDNIVTGNTATTRGGGIYISGWGASVDGNLIADNDAGSWGGGLYTLGTTATVSYSVIADNSAGLFGGAAYFKDGSPAMRNVTVVGNTGSGAVVTYSSALTIDKTIIAFHGTSAMQCFSGGVATVSCSDLYGNQSNAICGVDAGQNISADPLFCDSGDYSPMPSSPCTAENSPCGELIGAMVPCAVTGVENTSPALSTLYQNRPNPFNPTTTISFSLESRVRVTVSIHDAGGRLVDVLVDEERNAGPHSVAWNGTDRAGKRVSSGVYFLRLTTPIGTQAKKMVLLK